MLLQIAKATTAFILFLACGFHEVFGQDRFSYDSCETTTSTKTTTIGAVLMQSASTRVRLTADTRRAFPSHVAVAGDVVDANNGTLSLEAVVATASGVLQNVLSVSSKATRAAMDNFTKFYTVGVAGIAARDSTSTLILSCLALVLLGAIAYILLQHFARHGGNGFVPLNGLNVPSRPAREPGIPPDLLVHQRCESPQMPLSSHSPVLSSRASDQFHERGKISGMAPPRNFTDGVSIAASSAKMPSPMMQSRESPADSQFCPELIVPTQSECILLMPIDSERRRSSFGVTDVNGNLVLRVVPEPSGRLWRATIQTATGELLAQCCEAAYSSSSGAAREFQLLRAGGDIYGKLRHSQPQDRYLLTLVNGTVLHFWGNFETHSVNFTDDKDRLFATTETGASAAFDPMGKYCRLRVAPLVDVGLTICSLLCIGQSITDKHRTAMI